MNEPTGPGMGRPSGPGFTGPPLPGSHPCPPSSLAQGGQPSRQPPAEPKASRLPTILTLLAVAVVAAVVGVASVLAAREDVRLATPRPAPTVLSRTSTPPTDRIEFTTTTGSGVLEIVDHGWDSDGTDTTVPGSLLTLAVKVTCESGIVSYGPDSFQAFGRHGDLFDPVYLPDSSTALELGTLSAGQQVTGTVAFDIPRGGVTLLMTDERSRTMTALKVPD